MSSVVVAGPHPRRRLPFVALAVVGASALVTALVAVGNGTGSKSVPPAVGTAVPAAGATSLDAEIARTQQHLRDVPRDFQAWATLGFDYVQQAKLTVDPTYYPKSDAALRQSLLLDHTDNFVAMAGEAALASARHDFRSALAWARRGLRIDPRSAVLYGALTDAYTQLGRYDAAGRAAAHMEELSPGTPAESRLSYAAELRGDDVDAARFMRLALSNAASAADVAFARYYLGQLSLNTGHPVAAVREFSAGLAVSPTDTTLLEGRAKAEAALGQTTRALADFQLVVNRVPQPGYVLEYGELLQASGRSGAAAQQWELFRTEERLFRANGVTLDVDQILFEADHGNATRAVRTGARALSTRPFLDTYDAYAWALHRVGANEQALREADIALSTGVTNALFLFHRGEIERSLGNTGAAHRDLSRALQIDPTFSPLLAPQAREHLAMLDGATQ
jgi:tetratricopeptide (TPR) repeat protein